MIVGKLHIISIKISGTTPYMAPEVASKKKVNVKADVWSFGVVLFELFTFSRPYKGDERTAMDGLTKKSPDLPGRPLSVMLTST
jgi:serine/threonine protein kinase